MSRNACTILLQVASLSVGQLAIELHTLPKYQSFSRYLFFSLLIRQNITTDREAVSERGVMYRGHFYPKNAFTPHEPELNQNQTISLYTRHNLTLLELILPRWNWGWPVRPSECKDILQYRRSLLGKPERGKIWHERCC